MENPEVLTIATGAAELARLTKTAERARVYAAQATAENTRRAYRADWTHFTSWCATQRLQPLPAEVSTIVHYVTELAEHVRVSTIQRRLTSISIAHSAAGYLSPTKNATVAALWRGIRREKGTAQHGKTPTLTHDIRAMVATLPETLLGLRDRALLLVGFAGAFRRSELVSLDIEDLERTRDGYVITLRRSKTDQEGHGRKIGIPYGSHPQACAVRVLSDWLKAAGMTEGPVFRSVNRHGQLQRGRLTSQVVAQVVKRTAAAAGLDPAKYGGHSLRAGLVTSAAKAGKSERVIMKQTGHKSVQMVRRYIRDADLFADNAAAGIGL